ncbi:MAG: hypothetical protein H6Q86_5833 [candidate division NC10 bacterium]|nr:hypothetical protein [candidate division NC10 bacterium]
MPYMIDGHNLIGAMPGHRLEDPDDEVNLIARLQKFCAASGKAATVYFDRRSPGRADPPRIGRLTVHFIAESSSADQAIRAHLRRLRGDARNWTVVSSDGEVAAAAPGRADPTRTRVREAGFPALERGKRGAVAGFRGFQALPAVQTRLARLNQIRHFLCYYGSTAPTTRIGIGRRVRGKKPAGRVTPLHGRQDPRTVKNRRMPPHIRRFAFPSAESG